MKPLWEKIVALAGSSQVALSGAGAVMVGSRFGGR